MADNPNVDPSKKDKPDAAPSKLEQLILGIDARIQALEKASAGQRSLYDRQLNDLRGQLSRALARRQSEDYGEEDAPPVQRPAPSRNDEQRRMRAELLEFKVDHGSEYFSRKEKVDALVNDPIWQLSDLVYNEEGQIDYTKTYRAALRDVMIREGAAARQVAAQAEKEEKEKKDAAKKDATLSGDAQADEIPEGILDKSIDDLTDAELDQVMGLKPKRVAPVGVATSR